MTHHLLCILCVLVLAPCAWAQQVLVAWEFDTDGDTQGWAAAHSLAPLETREGALWAQVTDSDPYMFPPLGQFELEGNGFQYIEIRMRLTRGAGAAFYWASVIDGTNQGFVAGRERGFETLADGQWHTYRLYPLWSGRIGGLRFDPPEGVGTEVQIDYIRIIQGPSATHDPASAAWDFLTGTGGWVAMSGGEVLQLFPDGARTAFTARVLRLMGPAVELQAEAYPYAYIELDSDAPLEGELQWSASQDGAMAAPAHAALATQGGRSHINLDLRQNPLYAGPMRRLGLNLRGAPGTAVTLKRIALSERPLGPAHLVVELFRAEPALPRIGRVGRLAARVRNMGGQTLQHAQLKATVAGSWGRIVGQEAATVTGLVPGAATDLAWSFVPTAAGPIAFTLGGPDGLTARAMAVAAPSVGMPPVKDHPQAGVSRSAAWVGNGKIMLVLGRTGEAFGSGRIAVVRNGAWEVVGALPQLATLRLAGMDTDAGLALWERAVRTTTERAWLELHGSTQVAGATVQLGLRASVGRDNPWVEVSYSLTADRDLQVSAFRGPWLWAGEGAFGGEQDLALFPGLEFLEAGERSSSTLDIAPPGNVRFAPHPNMITIPTMAVEKDGTLVGLMWDSLQTWDGEHAKPAAAFASPNFVENHDNHLMGLFLPAIPQWTDPNTLQAARPFALAAGKSLTLSASLFAEPNSQLLRCIDLYLERFGLPELPPKARSYAETIAMSLKSLDEVLWVEQAKGWMPVLGWAPSRDQNVVLSYLLGSRWLADRAWATRLAQKGASLGDPGNLAFALHHLGAPMTATALRGLAEAGQDAARRAPSDGVYRFQPSEQTASLGRAGETASGLCAGGIAGMLEAAVRTGAREPLEAALRTLRYMERFRIPRASQVWEVPVHTPDILAAGHVAAVYLTAYKLTGDPALLARAAYWAKTGLPFVYLWQAPEQRPLMLGASIPVFGATYYSGSWLGVPVQWNGLAYAGTLLDLARYDGSLPWRRFAEMLTISAINMQSTRRRDYGTYTDNWNVVTDVEMTGCMLSPWVILHNTLSLLGTPVGVQTEVLRLGTEPICINSAAFISGARMDETDVRFSLRYDAGYTAWTAIMPVAEPSAVVAEGTQLPRDIAVEGWSYDPELRCLTIGLQFGDGARELVVRDARRDDSAISQRLPCAPWPRIISGEVTP